MRFVFQAVGWVLAIVLCGCVPPQNSANERQKPGGISQEANTPLAGCSVSECYVNSMWSCAVTVNFCPAKGSGCTCKGPNGQLLSGFYG